MDLPRLAIISSVLVIITTAPLQGRDDDDIRFHLRTEDASVRILIHQGYLRSPVFRALVDRLIETDVVVFLISDRRVPHRAAGCLSFVTSAGGVRYLAARFSWGLSQRQNVALMAHELQHALEIAAAPHVIDPASLAHEYHRIGFERGPLSDRTRTFDSQAAIDAGDRVWRDYSPD